MYNPIVGEAMSINKRLFMIINDSIASSKNHKEEAKDTRIQSIRTCTLPQRDIYVDLISRIFLK